jgi:hypothetical protein
MTVGASVLVLTLVLTVIGMSFRMVLHQSYDNLTHHHEALCVRVTSHHEDRLCPCGHHDHVCDFESLTYALPPDLSPTSPHLTISRYTLTGPVIGPWKTEWFDSAGDVPRQCRGGPECRCYYDDRNISATLTLDRRFYWSEIILLGLFILGVSVPFMAYEYLR